MYTFQFRGVEGAKKNPYFQGPYNVKGHKCAEKVNDNPVKLDNECLYHIKVQRAL
jgi:hypothetical protein